MDSWMTSRAWIGAVCVLVAPTAALAHEPEAPERPGLTAPVLLERVDPIYPEDARRLGIGGIVGLEITVGVLGDVTEVKVVHPAGFGLDDAALEAVRRFHFKPATKDGAPIVSTVLFDQHFVPRPHLEAELALGAGPRTATVVVGPTPEDAATSSAAPPGYRSVVVARGPTTAASASTIRNLDFELRPTNSPNDILRIVPGLLAVQHQGGGKADQLFLRGFDADHGTDVGVFVDGIPVNLPSHAHGQGFADLHWLIPEAIERIDVVKGPYDPQNGDFSTAGAVNLITRDRFEGSSVGYTLGAFPTIGGREVASGRLVGIAAPELASSPKLHSWLAFEAAYDEGPFDRKEDLTRYNAIGKLSYTLAPDVTLGLLVEAYGSGWVGSGQIPAREVAAGRLAPFGSEDPSEGGLTERQMAAAFVHAANGEDSLDLTVYVTRYRLSLWNDFTFFLSDPTNGDEIEQDDARTVSGARVSYTFTRHLGELSLETRLGADLRYDGVHVERWSAESQGGDFRKRIAQASNLDIDETNLAGYLNLDLVVSPRLRFLGGIRADFFGFDVSDRAEAVGAGQPNTSGVRQFGAASPKASAVVTPVLDRLDLYLNFGAGFHSNAAEVALEDGSRRTASDGSSFTVHALPRFYGGELGARAHLMEGLDFAAALWGSTLENETVFDADQGTFVPSAPTRRLGVDLEARARILSWLYADLDLSQASATKTNGAALALAPRLYLSGGLTVKHPAGVRAGLRARVLGDRPAFDTDSPEYRYFTARTLPDGRTNPDYDPSRVTASGYFVLDAYAAYRWEFLEAAIAVQNLLNSSWREAQFGNRSCTADETRNPSNPNYAGSGNTLADGTFVDRCGVSFGAARSGVVDVHYTPGVPLNLQLTLKAYF
jgi:TonB family protein